MLACGTLNPDDESGENDGEGVIREDMYDDVDDDVCFMIGVGAEILDICERLSLSDDGALSVLSSSFFAPVLEGGCLSGTAGLA